MKPKQLLPQLGILIVAFVLLNLVMAKRSDRLPSRDILHKIQGAQGFDTVFVGNSLMANGVKEKEFDAVIGAGSSLNVGLNSSKSAEHSLLLRYTLTREPKLQRCVLGYVDTQLSDIPGGVDTIQGHQTIAFILEPELAARYYSHGFWETQQFRLFARVPYLAERTALWMRVEQVRRSLEQLGMPPVATTVLGRVGDFSASTEVRDRLYREALMRPSLLNEPMLQFLEDAKKSASEVVIIRMPIKSRVQTDQMRSYHQRIQQEITAKGVRYLDATAWEYPAEWFEDEIHLNAVGAEHFSRQLAQTLKETPR